MYELNIDDIKQVAGAKWVYITPAWKENEKMMSGYFMGSVMAAMGISSTLFAVGATLPIWGAALLSGGAGVVGYKLGQCIGLSADLSRYEDNTWMWFSESCHGDPSCS